MLNHDSLNSKRNSSVAIRKNSGAKAALELCKVDRKPEEGEAAFKKERSWTEPEVDPEAAQAAAGTQQEAAKYARLAAQFPGKIYFPWNRRSSIHFQNTYLPDQELVSWTKVT